jgi:hypothetical protein
MFGFSRRKQKTPIDRRRSLEAIPVLNQEVSVARMDNDRVILTVRLTRGTGLLSRFQPPIMKRNVKLDAVGTFVFHQIDGKRTTRDIIDVFIDRYRVNRREAELSCVQFLKSLAIRRVISIVVP